MSEIRKIAAILVADVVGYGFVTLPCRERRKGRSRSVATELLY